ncbi:NAD(P)-dependent dehydrogenase (short-subunit alcohol dehydrogenase family) [Actinoplanes tereljensis]|uniref:Short-chain dehydrogenase/reductase n=1 Tax=Paractinoplanes tereljensis TaxID=571912 RepID=A0A919NLD2_9ACTN|nr:SDR family NAD(P)-dependent oxidoreductase [Actinoplanes tereljensis]GIF20081.1 short-chain dehydrogenase/reductase [Actinoplanes tereljensis]
MTGQVVLVTGASSGFGRLIAETLARRGHRVFAGLREVRGRNEKAAASLEGAGLQVVELDVTDQDSADRAVAAVVRAAGRLDVVVNNAGGIFVGPVESFTAAEAQRQFDVNVLGALRVNRAALPHLREQGSGALIQIGSVAARVTVPFSGLYAASKAALAALTEAWHDELAPFGVESIILDPASYPTNIGVNATMPADHERMAPYGTAFGGYVAAITGHAGQTPADAREVSDAVVRLVETPNGERPRRTVVAPDAQHRAVAAFNRAADAAAAAVTAEMGVAAFTAAR